MNSAGKFFIIRSGALEDEVVEAAGFVHAAVKAAMKFRPEFLAREMTVRPAGVFPGAASEQTFPCAEVLERAAIALWYRAAPDGSGFLYTGAPDRRG